MQLISILGHLFSTAVIGFVGFRLLMRGSHGSSAAPERWLGWSLVAGCLGYVGIMATVAVPGLTLMQRGWLAQGASCIVALGSICLLGFVRSVFQPGEGWGRALFIVGGWLLAIVALTEPLRAGWPTVLIAHPLYWVEHALNALPIAWVMLECARQAFKQRRQRALGLGANALVVNRFVLFAIWGALRLTVTAAYIASTFYYLEHRVTHPGLDAVVAITAAGAALMLLMIMMPSARYRRWLGAPSAELP